MQKGRLVTGDRWNGAFTLRQKRTDGEANELSGKVVSGPEEWRGNHRGAHTHGSAYTGNCWDTRVKSVSRFMVLADIPQKAHTKAAYVQLLFFSLFLSQAQLEKVWATTVLSVWQSSTWVRSPWTARPVRRCFVVDIWEHAHRPAGKLC